MSDVVVFLGPSLTLERAREVLPSARYLPPARQGDVFRALADTPRVLVLIDGVFESVPSVWHHELRAALGGGVHVIGASSMGALRAAELRDEGMRPVGRIARSYADGSRVDDADVALLHADADDGFRGLTVPLVNVEATVAVCVRRRLLTSREARALLRTARATFFKDRSWRGLVDAQRWSQTRRAECFALLRRRLVDQKALDALEALRVARQLMKRKAPEPRLVPLSSFVRRQRLLEVDGETLRRLQRRPDADALAKQGLRTLLLAEFARLAGLDVAFSKRRTRGQALDESMAAAQAVALEALVLSAPERFVSDGPSWLEGLAFEARRRGVFR